MAACATSSCSSSRLPLAGRRIVVTRPAHQGRRLCESITAAGGQALSFPLLTIRPVDPSGHERLLTALAQIVAGVFDLVVFVSPNAIEQTFDALVQTGKSWPSFLRVAVVGKGSESALAERGIRSECVIAPEYRFDSEGLLALPALGSVHGWRVLILRGDGGRELIANTLRERGATVELLTCYHRDAPEKNTARARLRALWRDEGGVDALTLTSSEGLRHLHALTAPEDQSYLRAIPLFLPHARIAQQALELGLGHLILTEAGDDGLMAGLIRHFAPLPPSPLSSPSITSFKA